MPEGFMGRRGSGLGDGVGDDGLAFFFQQFDQPPLLRHQPVNLRRLAVEERGDGGLLGERRKRQLDIVQFILTECRRAVRPFASTCEA